VKNQKEREKNPNGGEGRKKKKAFSRWQLNLFAPIKWQPKWIWLPPLDGNQNESIIVISW